MAKGFGLMDTIANVTEHLEDIDFPKDKEDLVEYARDHNAPDRVVEILEKLPDQVYGGMSDVLARLRGI